MRTTLTFVIAALLAGPALAQKNPKELGRVTWIRSLEDGQKQAKKLDRPIFLQFQEVPG